MPSVIAHCWYGDVACSRMGQDRLQNIIKQNHGAYMIGCQGPDVFFFYHRWPWQNSSNNAKVGKYAALLHRELVNDAFDCFLDYVKEHRDDEVAIAWMCGYMAHWALDSRCHPYIFYRTGSLHQDIGNDHQMFEGQIDRGVLAVNNTAIEDYQSRKLTRYPERLAEVMWNMMAPLFREHADMNMEKKEVEESLRDFMSFQKFFYDPRGTKCRWVAFGEKFTNTKGLATAMIMPFEYDDALDAMNLRHDFWVHPCDDSQVSSMDFTEMAREAVENHLQLLGLLDDFLYGEGTKEPILALIGNRQFETGLQPGIKMLYFKKDGIEGPKTD